MQDVRASGPYMAFATIWSGQYKNTTQKSPKLSWQISVKLSWNQSTDVLQSFFQLYACHVKAREKKTNM